MAAKHQPDLFAAPAPQPDGLRYREAVLSPSEERAYAARFAALPFKPFEFHGYLGKRRIVSFGWRYDYAGHALRESVPIPDFLLPLRETAGAFAGLPAAGLQQALVTEYAAGAGIGWHRDKPMFDDVVALSFLADCTLRLRRRRGPGWERAALPVAPRSAYLLRGAARHVWEHSVPPVAALRYSVTFRNFAGAPTKA
ncbi:MAG: alpha-ketoglutarate-dependent dioxygenase AlkB [Rhizomicrobium sp.]